MNNKLRLLCIALLLNYVSFPAIAQTGLTKIDLTRPVNIVSPSANVSSLMKLVEVPVSYYTGTPQINFPLYSLQNKKISLNIGLSYNASGIKVEEDASIVGLGFNLVGGGSIARAIAGKPDEQSTGYRQSAQSYQLPLYDTANPEQWLQTISSCTEKLLATGTNDLLPDTYYLNFNGNSAKMYFDKNGNALISPYKAWSVTGNENTGFVVTVEDGTIYQFAAMETTSTDVSNNANDDQGSSSTAHSAWFLTRIISPALTDTVNLSYTPIVYSTSAKNNDETYIDLVQGQNPPACAGIPTFNNKVYYVTNQSVSTYLLSTIESKLERIEFINGQGRLDIEGVYGGMGSKLNEINIYKKAGNELIKRYRFDYNYFGNPTSNQPIDKRLMLTGFKEIGLDDSLAYSFSYINPTGMPSRNSKAQDHWGYYNGASNFSTLIPAYTDAAGNDLSGADREPKNDLPATGLLSQVVYPTGGKVNFTYENNDYSFLKGVYINNSGALDSIAVDTIINATTVGLSGQQGSRSKTFFLPQNLGPATFTCVVKGKITGDALADVYVKDYGATTNLLASGDTHGVEYTLGTIYPLPNTTGRTLIIIASREQSTESAVIYAHYKKWRHTVRPVVYSKLGGGVRVKTIVESGNADPAKNTFREFKYLLSDTISSGNLADLPVYENYSYIPVYCNSGGSGSGTPVKVMDLTCINRHSVSMNALGRTQGSTVGYSKVTVLLGVNGANGKEEYSYSSGPADGGGSGYPYIPRNNNDDLRGLLLKKVIYNSNGIALKTIENTYQLNNQPGNQNFKWIFGAKYGIRKQNNTLGDGGCPTSWDILGGMFKVFQYWPVLISTKESDLDVNSGVSLVNNNSFSYNSSNLLLSRQVHLKSNADSTVSILTYPQDYAGQAAYDGLIARHMLNNPVEKTIFNNTQQIYREKTNYDFSNTGMISPKTVEIQQGGYPTELRYNFSSYDLFENIQEEFKTGDSHSSYIWGYSGQYLLAEIKGATYAAANQLIDQTLLNNSATTEDQMRIELNKLRTGLPNAQVITYTYKPLTGLGSRTDPKGQVTYYEYDGFQRLKTIKDQNGNIVKSYNYHYSGQ